jgi:hypothetical protein
VWAGPPSCEQLAKGRRSRAHQSNRPLIWCESAIEQATDEQGFPGVGYPMDLCVCPGNQEIRLRQHRKHGPLHNPDLIVLGIFRAQKLAPQTTLGRISMPYIMPQGYWEMGLSWARTVVLRYTNGHIAKGAGPLGTGETGIKTIVLA